MKLCEIEPHLRFAATLRYEMPYNKKPVKVTDCRIFYVIEGQAEIAIDGSSYLLVPGSLFYCCAGSQYTVQTRDGFSLISLNFDLSQAHSRQALPFSPERDPKKWNCIPVYAEAVDDSRFLNTHFFLSNGVAFRETAEKIVTDFAATDQLSQQLCCQRLKLLLMELHGANNTQIPEKVHTVQEYIRQHYAEKITNKTLADLVGYHEYYLNRIFHASTGMNLHSYLLSVRLNHAKSMILNTAFPLQTIAEQTGFGSYAHFSAYFKQTYQQSPAQYRKHLRSNI